MFQRAFLTIIKNALLAMQRFPLPVLCSVLFFIFAVRGGDNEVYLAILFCSCFWFITLELFAETHSWRRSYYWIAGIIGFLAIGWSLYGDARLSAFLFLGPGLFLSIFIAPFLRMNTTSPQMLHFGCIVLQHICITFVAALIIYLGLSAIFASLKFLFGANIPDKIYWHAWLVAATLFSPIFAMGGIPRQFESQEEILPKATHLILSYILLPLFLIYTPLLYGYAAKILLTWTLPEGGVAYLVMGFGVVGMMIYLLSYPLHQRGGIITLFSRYFFLLLPVPLLLLAIAIWVRVQEYGVTEERYAVLLCLIWLSLSMVLTLLARHRDTAKWICIAAVALLIGASFGPWGATAVSAWSQIGRLENILEKNQILIAGRIHKPTGEISRSDRIAISEIVDYLVNSGKKERLQPWFAQIPEGGSNSSPSAATIMQDMGLEYINEYARDSEEDFKHFDFVHHDENDYDHAIPVSGYDYVVILKDIEPVRAIPLGGAEAGKTWLVEYDRDVLKLVLREKGGKDPLVFDLEETIRQLSDEKIDKDDPRAILDKENSNFACRLIIDRILGTIEVRNKKLRVNNLAATILVKIKKKADQ